MDRPEPRLSVAMTTYNAEHFLPAQLESMLAQTRLPDEVVVWDDASTDATWHLLQIVAARWPVPFAPIRQPHKVGLRRNIQDALTSCSGDVVVLADADDLWAPTKLEAVADAFRDPDVALWFSDADLVDEWGEPTGGTTWQATHLSSDDVTDLEAGRGLRRLLHGQTVTGATMAARRDVLELALPLPDELDGHDHLFLHDGWLAVLAALRGRVVADPRRLTFYRQHPAQMTSMSMTAGGEASAMPVGPTPDQLALDHARVTLVADRLRAADADAWCRPDVLFELRDLEYFLKVRVMPPGRARATSVVRELRRGAYARHARGLRTALKDLVRAAPPGPTSAR